MKPMTWRSVGLSVLLFIGVANRGHAQEYGIAAKRPVIAGACKTCPWGALAEIVKAAMAPYGYDVQICYNCATSEGPREVAGALKPGDIQRAYTRSRSSHATKCVRHPTRRWISEPPACKIFGTRIQERTPTREIKKVPARTCGFWRPFKLRTT